MLQPVLGHSAFLDQPGDIIDVDLAPRAFPAARCVALQITLVVKTFADSVDPAPAKRDVDRLLRRDRRKTGTDLMDLDPDLAGAIVVLAEPFVEGVGGLEFAHFLRIDDDWSHQRIQQ
jgi:hypothetical protein